MPRPSQLGPPALSSVSVMPSGPALRLIPATPVDPSMNTNITDRMDSLEKPSSGSSTVFSDQTVELEVTNSSKTSPELTRKPSLLNKNIDHTLSRSSSAKSRTSSYSTQTISDLQKSETVSKSKSSTKTSIRSSTKGSYKSQQGKTGKKEEKWASPDPSLVRSSSDCNSKQSKKTSSIKKSIRLVKKKSFRREGEETTSLTSPGKIQKKSSFYKVMDKLRGISRRSSVLSGGSGGQAEFLDSISRMSDSRIVENWLLSLDDDQQSVDVEEGPSSLDIPALEEAEKGKNLLQPKSRTDELVTPTNEHFEPDTKAISSEANRIVFDISTEDLSNFEDNNEKCPKRFNARNFGRQVSESSEYTTDTHDTGETAHVTALNTLRNTRSIFTSEGDEMRRSTLSPPSPSSAIFKPILLPETEDLEVEAINSDRTDSHQTFKSTETMKTISSTVQIPHSRLSSESSDVQGRVTQETKKCSDNLRQSQEP